MCSIVGRGRGFLDLGLELGGSVFFFSQNSGCFLGCHVTELAIF